MALYLVTGGAGFIGTNLVKQLLAEGRTVRVLDNFSGGRFADRIISGVDYSEGDIRSAEVVLKALAGCSGVFHLAAIPRVSQTVADPFGTHEHNVIGTLQVLLAARAIGNIRVVLSSSSAVYGNQESGPLVETMKPRPISPYGLQKYESEEYCRLFSELYGVPTISLRYFNVYGPHMDPEGAYALVVGKFLKARQRQEPLTICGDGEYYREYVHVHDIARANIAAMQAVHIVQGEVFNIGSGRPTSVNELARLIGGPTVFIPERPGDPRHSEADGTKARTLLGWQPTIELEAGIADLKQQWGIA